MVPLGKPPNGPAEKRVMLCFGSATFIRVLNRHNLQRDNQRLAQMRVTVMCERSPSSAASLREDQCVDPSAGVWLVVHASTRASSRSVTL